MFGTPRSQDPLPEYVSPELVRLIAKNAPAELDFFVHYLTRPRQSPRSVPWRIHRTSREVQAERDRETRAAAVEELLIGIKDRNDWIAARKGQGAYQSFSAQQSARSDLETLSSTRSSPPKRTTLLSKERELRNVSLEGLESNVTRILGRDFCLTKQSERVNWPLPPEARNSSRDADYFPYHRIRKRGFGTRQALGDLPPPSAKFKNFFIGKTVSQASSNSSDNKSESLSPPARRQRLPLKKTVPSEWETFETDIQAEDGLRGCASKQDRSLPSKPKASTTVKRMGHAAWIPPGKPTTALQGGLPPMGPHSSRPWSARLPIGNRPASPAWIPTGQPSRRPVSAPSGPTISKYVDAKNGLVGKGTKFATEAPEIFKRAWNDFKDSEDFEKKPSLSAYVKPWRRGMSTNPTRPVVEEKKSYQLHRENLSEVIKFMEAKQSQRRKEQRDLKRKGEEEVAAKKEKERLLQLHHQAMLEMELEQAKEKAVKVRPAWNPDFDAARADGIGPWASPENNFQARRKGTPAVVEKCDAPVVTDSTDDTHPISQDSTEETDSVRSRNLHVVLRPKKRGKGKSRQRKAHKPTEPKDPFEDSKKRARWKNSTNMNAYGGKEALKRRELMKIYGVLQCQQREVVDSRKHLLRPLQGGVKKGTSSRKTAKGKVNGKARSVQRDESGIKPPQKSESDVSHSLRKDVYKGSRQVLSRGSSKGQTQLTTRLADVTTPTDERNFQAPTRRRNTAIQRKLGMASSSRKRKEQPDVQDQRPQRREPTKRCAITAAAATTKQRKLESPPLVYFSDQAHISDSASTIRPLSPFKGFPSTLRPTSPSNETHSFDRDRKTICGGGFHFKSSTKPLPSTQTGRIDVKTTNSGVETGLQRAGSKSERGSPPRIRLSYSALATAQGPNYGASSMKEAFDLNELEQAGSLLSRQTSDHKSERHTSNQKSVSLSQPSSIAQPSKQSSSETLRSSHDVSPSYHGSSLPSNRHSLSATSSLREEDNWQKEKTCHDSHEKGQIFQRVVVQQEFEESTKVSPPRDKLSKEWTLPRRRDSFSIVNLYAKYKAQEKHAQESKDAALTSSGVLADGSHPITQDRRLTTTGNRFDRNHSRTNSSEFKKYVAANYEGNISNHSESEILFSELMAEMSGKKSKVPLRRPTTADFIRSIQMDLAKLNASTEGRTTTSRPNGSTTPGLSRDSSNSRIESEVVHKEQTRTMNHCFQKFKVPTAKEMPSTGMHRKLNSKLPELSVDGVRVLSTSEGRLRESYTDMFSHDDSEALALFKMRKQLRKEQRLVRKLRRVKKMDDAGLQHTASGTRTTNHSVLKENEKVPEDVLDLRVSASQRRPRGVPSNQKNLRPPNHPRAQVRKHPQRTRLKKTRLQNEKLDTEEGHGIVIALNGVGHKKERQSSVIQHQSLLERKIQQLTTQISEITEKRLSDQQKCEITSRSFIEPSTSFMPFTLDETNRKSISSAVKVISLDDIASDSSHGKGSPEQANEKCRELEQSLSNRGGYSDSFLSEESIFEKNYGSQSMPATNVTERIRKEFSKGRKDGTAKDKIKPDSTKCPPEKLHYASVHEITEKESQVHKLNTPVLHIGKKTSPHGGLWKQMKKAEVPTQSTASVKTEACRFLDTNQKDMEDVSKDGTFYITPAICDEKGIQSRSLLALAQSNVSQTNLQNHSKQGGQGNCPVDLVKNVDVEEDKNTLQTGTADWVKIAISMDPDGGGLVNRIKGPTSFRKAEAISKEIENTHSRLKDPKNNKETQHSFEKALLLIEEDIMPLPDREKEMQHEIVTDGLSTVELPSLQQNLREIGHLYLAHSPPKQTSLPSKGLGHDSQDSMHTRRLQRSETSGNPVKRNMSRDWGKSGESYENRPLQQTTNRAEDDTDKPLKQHAISGSSNPGVASTGTTAYIPLTIEPSQVDTCDSILSEEIVQVQAASSIEEEECLQCASSQVRTTNTVSYTNDFSIRRPSTKQTADYRQDDDNDNESTKSINSPFRTVEDRQEPEDPKETICHGEMVHYPMEGNETESAPPKGGFQAVSDSSSERALDGNSCLKSSEVTYDSRQRHQDTGRPELRADNNKQWNGEQSPLAASSASQNDAYCAGSHGSPEKSFADSGMNLVSQKVQYAKENESVSPHETNHEGKADEEPESILLNPCTSVLAAPTTVNEHKYHDTTATSTQGDSDEGEIPEDIICEDLDSCPEVSASSVHDIENHSNLKLWIHDGQQCQNDELKGDMFRQEQEDVTSMSSNNAKVNKAECSEGIPKTVCKPAKQPIAELVEASDGPYMVHERWHECNGELSSSMHDAIRSTSTDWTPAPVTNVGEQHIETGGELSTSSESRLSGQLGDIITHNHSDGPTGTSSDKLGNFSDLLEQMPVTEETKQEKHHLLTDLLTNTLLDGLLQAELSDTVGQNISVQRKHDPSYMSASTFKFWVQAEHPQQSQNTRKDHSLPKQQSSGSYKWKAVKVPNQAAVRRYQTRGVPSRKGSSEDDNRSPGSLSPSNGAEYDQNLLSLQNTEGTETKKMVVETKAFRETESNQTTLDLRVTETHYMYDKLLLDAVDNNFVRQTASFNAVPQLTGRKIYNLNAFKPISACNALKAALASITDGVELANTTRSQGQARFLQKKQAVPSCEEWQMSWLETNELLVNELADGILTEMVGSMILDMPERGTCIS